MRAAATLLVVSFFTAAVVAADVYPPPGKLVDVGGHKIHLNCTGKGAPTVVLVAGASSFSIDFALVQPTLSRHSRVCAIDRAGYGWSDRAGVDDAEQVVRDLHAVLARTKERRPFVLVGQSLGSRYVRLYHARYSSDVGGMVLIDGEHEDGLFIGVNGKPVAISSLSDEEFAAVTAPASGPPQQVPEPRLDPAYRKLPDRLQAEHMWLLTRFFDGMRASSAAEVDAFQKANHAALVTLHQIDTDPHPLKDLPLFVLSRGVNNSALQQRLQNDLARLSTNSKHLVVADSDHEIHLFRPDVTIDSIGEVVRAVRTRGRLQ
jgi:pimeloyl-ACP methyl ester carboxylesterase